MTSKNYLDDKFLAHRTHSCYIPPMNVLYVTHEPGNYHNYSEQLEKFKIISTKNHWNLTILSDNNEDIADTLASDNAFGGDADVIIYNICLADCDNLLVPYNIIKQTEELGKNALLLHCSLHSFWPTYNETGESSTPSSTSNTKARARKDLIKKWQEEHPTKTFPTWSNFTGIASAKHTAQMEIKSEILVPDHPIFKNVNNYTTHEDAELYTNFITTEETQDVTPLLQGSNEDSSDVILWERHLERAKLLCFSLGHNLNEWNQPDFKKILVNSINYLGQKTS